MALPCGPPCTERCACGHRSRRWRNSAWRRPITTQISVRKAERRLSLPSAGSNTFHGTVFQFLRNDVLDARNFFENPASPKKPLRRNNFGAVLSGRIIRDKLFFTTNYEGYIERSSSQAFGVYPTDAMKQGDLTAPFFHAGGNPNNPLTPIRDALNSDAPFPNNQIPSNRIVTQSQKLMQYFLEPNLLGPFTGSNNYS